MDPHPLAGWRTSPTLAPWDNLFHDMKYLHPGVFIPAQLLIGLSIMCSAIDSLPLPEDFDYEAYLIGKEVDGKLYHSPRRPVENGEKWNYNYTAPLLY